MDGKLYFAYGSNINLDQMAHRCPDAQVVGPVVLDNYELLFRGSGIGSGVATIAPKKGKKVYGLLWKLTRECEESLNQYEGFPRLYGKENVTVRDKNGQEFTVMAYVMTAERGRTPAPPSLYYYEGIRDGYRQNGLPAQSLGAALRKNQRELGRRTESRAPARSGSLPRRRRNYDR